MASLQQPTHNQENESSKSNEIIELTNNNQTILNILRSEVEKTLNSLIKDKFTRTFSSNELNDYCSSGVSQLLKIYSNEQTVEKKTTQNDTDKTKENNIELNSILNALALSSQQILERVHQVSQSQLKKQFEKQEIVSILTDLASQESSNGSEANDDDEKNDEEDSNEIDDEEELEDEDEEECVDMTEEEFSREIAEAFENIRRLGRVDGQRIARFVRDTFCEINGREPELREMADVFTRIKDKLAQEAKEDGELLSSSRNIIIKDDITNADDVTEQTNVPTNENEDKDLNKKFGLLSIDVNNASKEEKEELLKVARGIVKEDLQIQAKNQLSKLIGREPSKQELNDMLVQLATTSLLDCNFDSSDDASDYNPDANEEKQQLLSDIQETTAFDEENSREREEPTLIDKPVLTTPVKNKGNSSRVDYYFEQYSDDCSQLLINKAIGSFKKLHNRVPSNEEVENIKQFLHTEKADLLNDQVTEANENNKENTSFKLNFGAEDTIDVD